MANETRRVAVRRPPTSALLRAKLRAPAMSDRYVRRPRLIKLLDSTATTPITLISAPAGAGKTTLAAGWVAESSSPAAWVSLDNTDQDARLFWTSVIRALQSLLPGCGEHATLVLRSGATVAEAVGELLDELDAEERPAGVLVIDDLQMVDNDATVATSLALFTRYLPAWLHLVLLSRREPKLPCDRLRSRGQLGEVHFAELRFTPAEARELMSRLTSPALDDKIEVATAHADGWAAGLQLAALAARSDKAQPGCKTKASGEDVLIHDYIRREVLAAEPPELIETLSKVAVVERVNPSLARVLTDRTNAGELLLRAEDRGLFITRLGAGNWFEIHSLMRAALAAELGSRSPSQLAELHVRAAQWFEQADEVPLALEHWLRADRPREALRLLAAQVAALYDSGREATIQRTLAAIAFDPMTTDLESMIEFALCHLLVNRRRFIEIVDQTARLAGQSPPPGTILQARVTMLRSISAITRGSWGEGGALARQAIQDLGDTLWRDPLGRIAWNMVARDMALSERWDDATDEATQARLMLGRDPGRRVAFEGTHALGHALAGRPIEALQLAAGIRRAASVANMSALRAELAVAEAMAHREVGDRPQALTELDALAEAPAEATLYCRILAYLELAQGHVDEGDLETARDTFEKAESLARSEFFGPDGRDWLSRVATVLALASGEIDEARRMSRQIRDPFWQGLNIARVHLAEGHRAEALTALKTLSPRCPRHEVLLALLMARAVDDYDEAVKCATSAVERAVAAGLLQTVASEGAEVADMVERAAWRAPPSWLERFRRAAGSTGPRPGGTNPIDPLTERERDVLRLLPSRLTVREIADELYISANTLKYHLKVIYRKLGVSSRAEASAAARRMGRLSLQS
jgi:LuxR family maltose regulon positive regulatory protein